MPTTLSPADGAALVALARAAIAEPLRADGSLDRALANTTITPALATPRAVFVTLKIAAGADGEKLRGCIGTMDTTVPLFRNVVLTAPRAAANDPRFPPLAADELDRVRIEVSALTPLEPLAEVASLELGRDGVQLDHGDKRALFLPQVGRERDWTVEQFLEHLALKAGLARGAWRESRLSVFRVEAFHSA